jgi:hypothetical protein
LRPPLAPAYQQREDEQGQGRAEDRKTPKWPSSARVRPIVSAAATAGGSSGPR